MVFDEIIGLQKKLEVLKIKPGSHVKVYEVHSLEVQEVPPPFLWSGARSSSSANLNGK